MRGYMYRRLLQGPKFSSGGALAALGPGVATMWERMWRWWLLLIPTLAQAQVQLVNPGDQLHLTVVPATWSWFELPLLNSVGRGHAAIVTLDSGTQYEYNSQFVFARFDMLLVSDTLPPDAQTLASGPVIDSNPLCWFNELCENSAYSRVRASDRITLSLSHNATDAVGPAPPIRTAFIGVREKAGAPGLAASCTPPFSPHVTRPFFPTCHLLLFVSISGAPGPVSLKLHFRAIPLELRDGDRFVSALPRCAGAHTDEACRQYFSITVGSYDILQITLLRLNGAGAAQNLTTLADDGKVISTGLGLVGEMMSARANAGALQSAFDGQLASYDRHVLVSNLTDEVTHPIFSHLSHHSFPMHHDPSCFQFDR